MTPLFVAAMAAGCAWLAMSTIGTSAMVRRPARVPPGPATTVTTPTLRAGVRRVSIDLVANMRARTERRRGMEPAAVATWCDDLARRARSGDTMRDVLASATPTNTLLADLTEPVRRDLERGRSLREAADECSRRCRSGAIRGGAHAALALDIIAVTADIGGSSAAPLDRVAAALRLRAADQEERRAHSAQARLSAHALTVVPVAMLSISLALDAGVRHTVSQPVGALSIGGGIVLNTTGWWWMRLVIGAAP